MSTTYPGLRAEDVERLARVTADCRARPERYADGRELLEARFAPAVIQERRWTEFARKCEQGGMAVEPVRGAPPGFTWTRQAFGRWASTSGADSIREALDWAATLDAVVWRPEAEALCLLVVALWDDNRAPNSALPLWLRTELLNDELWRWLRGDIIRREVGALRERLAAAVARIRSQEDASGTSGQSPHAPAAVPQTGAGRGTGADLSAGQRVLAPDAFLALGDIALAEGVPLAALRKRVARWQRKSEEGWREVTDRKPRESKYLYQVGAIRHLIRPRIASRETSSDRPANGIRSA